MAPEWLQRYIKLYFRCSMLAKSVVGRRVWHPIRLIQTFTVVLVICKTKEDPFQNEGARVI